MVSRKHAKLESVKSKKDMVFKSKSNKSIKKKIKTAVHVTTRTTSTLVVPKSKPENIKISTEPAVKKKIKYTMPSKSITESIVEFSLQALNKLMAHQNNKNIIFGDETSIFLEIRCIKIQNTRGNLKFVLPHSTVASSGEVCLITPDLRKGRKANHEPTVEHWEEILKNAEISEIKTILPMRQLRVEYDQFELKRRLLTQHDFIMVDTRVLNHVSHLLGKIFFKKHNMVIPVKINEKGHIKNDIAVGLRTSMLRLNEGDTSSFLVGHTSMPHHEIKENILSFVQQLNNKFPGGEANIRSISLKLPLSLSLPLYITLRPSNTVSAPKLNKSKPKDFVEVEDELSTIPGSKVRVAPDGSVLLKKIKEDKRQDNEEEDNEGEENYESEIENVNL